MGMVIITIMIVALTFLACSLYKYVTDPPSCIIVGLLCLVLIGIIIGTVSEMINK